MQGKHWRRFAAILLLSPLGLLGLNDLHAALFVRRASLPDEVVRNLQVGDVVFTREPYYLLRKVADASGSWSNHVGIVIDTTGAEPLVAESKVPKSVITPLSRFVGRSEAGYVAVRRPVHALSIDEENLLAEAARARMGRWYDLGFNLHSSRQFCSKLVYESLRAATGEEVGEVSNFEALLKSNPDAPLAFWRIWYLGRIPWQRETVTPASQLVSAQLATIYDASQPQPREPGASVSNFFRETH
ncbi:YiiX/YebB-like N1pC/P60 family cysteine hydrolase [Uliginosibacterium sp. 31-16]|uniref:YiiX/YebB-like N1pC/P60 family cysteine hydrolase n=1 Tax=Uliginosibacterium sp. 31-16 TaxID=3068315 RepID=UPI00273FAA48|nr:YiiX/YebB-like N1pC/P60 family cysteine hydrolase [Uliginosibacterium sp. 31-16]MDP5238683.1 YiiX/YebB-like N1pC/P60 family cysteine hydrolase [Uliginosibacterium sp. 31-16]